MPVRCFRRATFAFVLVLACPMAPTATFAAAGVALPASVPDVSDAVVDAAVDASGRSLDIAALAERLRSARYVLLGEIHDDAQHHQLRAALLRALPRPPTSPARRGRGERPRPWQGIHQG